MGFINLHAHTNYSDGRNSVDEMAKTCKALGFSACVITDHVYGRKDDKYSLNTDKYFELQRAAVNTSVQVGMPVIVGIEIGVGGMEECCIFGNDLIIELLARRDASKGSWQLKIETLKQMRKHYDCAVNLCHPMSPAEFARAGGAEILDGFEYIHMTQYEFKHRPVPEEFECLVRLCNSDAHNDRELGLCYNETDTPITDERGLIQYLQQRRPVRHIVNERAYA